mgnify:CR=1 FL=1
MNEISHLEDMKIVFFGTPDYVMPILKALHKKYDDEREKKIIAVVTQSPKESGRNKFITRTPVDNWAYKHNIPVIYNLDEVPEADLGIVAPRINLSWLLIRID